MSTAETSILQPVAKSRSNSMQEYKSCQTDETSNSSILTEYPPGSGPPTMQLHPAGSCNSFYGGAPPVGYTDYTDRFSMGYQRMGQTITLTSHKIQFGCQQVPHPTYSRQLQEPVLRPGHYMIQPVQNKSWADTSIDHAPPPQPTSSAPNKSNNRGRTTYTDDQIAELESVFHNNPYPTAQTRQHLAFKIDVPEGKVKIWFQNRRARAKKIKMGCGGGGNWRTAHNESKNNDEHTNQNNNNMKDNKVAPVETSSISINSLLPLPTKPSIASSRWPGSSCMHPWRTIHQDTAHSSNSCKMYSHPHSYCADHSGYPCAPTGSRQVRMWNWGTGAYVAQPCHTMYKPELEDCKVRVDRDSAQTGTWNSNYSFGNVPDLVSKTSRVGLNDSIISNGDDNVSNTSKNEHPHESSVSETGQANISGRFPETVKLENSYDSESCSIAPMYNSHFYAGILPQEIKPQPMNELSSPPPIRRLIFPFHTLTDAKTVRAETNIMSASPYSSTCSRPLATASENYGYSIGTKAYPNSSTQFNIQAIKIPDSYQPYSYLTTAGRYADTAQYGLDADSYNHVAERWNPQFPSINIPEIREKDDTNNDRQNSSISDQIKGDTDDGEATDDAIDDVGLMDGDKPDEHDPASKSSYGYEAVDSQPFSSVCWSNRASNSNILVKAMEYAAEDDVEPKSGVDESASGLNNDVMQPSDSSAVWSNQLINGMYPSVSASMVG